MKAYPLTLLILAVLTTTTLTSCDGAKTPQTIEPVSEEKAPGNGDLKETEVTQSQTTTDIDDRASKSTMPSTHMSPATASLESEPAPAGKNAVNQSKDQANMPPADKRTKPARAVIPKKLRGIWSENDADGKLQCERYKLATRDARDKENDELSNSLVGSLVITRHMIHDYAEYGEGNFYAIERISRTRGDKWKVTAQIGIDTFPSDEDARDIVAFELSLSSNLLYWKEEEAPSSYFRCDDLDFIDENSYSM